MAYPPHALVAIVGGWNTTDMADEVWQVGIRVSTHDAAGGYLANPQTYCDSLVAGIKSWFTNTGNGMDGRATIQTLKVNNITPSGHYKDDVTHQASLGGITGGNTTSSPSFTCLCTTLETGATIGRAKRGRIYLPNPTNTGVGLAVSASPSDTSRAVNATKALLALLLKNEPTGGLLVNPVVVSRIDGTYRDINGVSANPIMDVQRRRKNRAAGTRTPITAFP